MLISNHYLIRDIATIPVSIQNCFKTRNIRRAVCRNVLGNVYKNSQKYNITKKAH